MFSGEDSPTRWTDSSVLLEVKPGLDSGNLFVACPEGRLKAVVKITRNGVECGSAAEAGAEEEHGVIGVVDGQSKVAVQFANVRLYPESVCSLAWADQDKVFTCRVRAELEGFLLDSKTSTALAASIKGSMNLDTFCRKLSQKGDVTLHCGNCAESLICGSKRSFEVRALPSDDWNVCENVDFFCHAHSLQQATTSVLDQLNKVDRSPGENQCLISESFVVLSGQLTQNVSLVDKQQQTLQCSHCLADIGQLYCELPDMYKFYHSATRLICEDDSSNLGYIPLRFGLLETYFAWQLLTQSKVQSTIKFVVKFFSGRPHILVWLLDSYCAMFRGNLRIQEGGFRDRNEANRGFLALKVMYKVFDESDTTEAPEVAGHDLGLLQHPSKTCLELCSTLMASTLSLPAACRSVGLFYVGFLKLEEIC